jgi:hypothetical protein
MTDRRRCLLFVVLVLVAGCGSSSTDPTKDYLESSTDPTKDYIAEIDKLDKLRRSRTEMIATLPDAARKSLEEIADVTAGARRRYFAAVEANDDVARKAATADEAAGNRAYDEAAERLLLEHVPAYKELQKRIAEQAARVQRAKEQWDASQE